ncbi:hypothetical protein [Streptosporangium sp. NPDC051022]|uniref:hypothetical protein n=1 Tax=Streptosporangium sp. NPDC051022 TaxID=3155752 RepID=UPI00343BED79
MDEDLQLAQNPGPPDPLAVRDRILRSREAWAWMPWSMAGSLWNPTLDVSDEQT